MMQTSSTIQDRNGITCEIRLNPSRKSKDFDNIAGRFFEWLDYGRDQKAAEKDDFIEDGWIDPFELGSDYIGGMEDWFELAFEQFMSDKGRYGGASCSARELKDALKRSNDFDEIGDPHPEEGSDDWMRAMWDAIKGVMFRRYDVFKVTWVRR